MASFEMRTPFVPRHDAASRPHRTKKKKTAKAVFGRSGGTRTRGLQYPKLARYHLRYASIKTYKIVKARTRGPKPALLLKHSLPLGIMCSKITLILQILYTISSPGNITQYVHYSSRYTRLLLLLVSAHS